MWVVVFVLAASAVVGKPSALLASTLFQTNISTYDPRIDLRTDGVIVHMHGHTAPTVAHALKHWREVGNYPVYRMWFIGSDAGEIFTRGNYDGVSHTDAIETGRSGNEFWQPGRPYMVPTPEWNAYMRQITREAIDAGVAGVTPEEPLAHTEAVYGEAFKTEWERFYGEPWEPPHLSVNARWKASKLQSHLYLEAVKAVIDEATSYGSAQGREIEVILPTHSLLSHAAGHMIYPNGASTRLPGLDGFIGQVWTGPVGWTLGRYEGKQLNRDNGFFDSAWLLYSSFANLTRGSNQRMFFLADPVEDDPKYQWGEYHAWYNQTLVAKLMFTNVVDYEVMPWPDRIFLPGYGTGGGSPGPAPYLTQLMVNVQALSDMPSQQSVLWDVGTRGIGVLVGDTLGWQRSGPNASSMDSFHGLALPLIRHGVPVEVLPIERVADAGYLDDYHVLLVSYDMWKPLEPKAHDALVQWVKEGGVIVFFDGDDAYNQVDEWWRQLGHETPGEHLMTTLGILVDLSSRKRVSEREDGSADAWREVTRAEADYHNLENLQTRVIDLTSFLPAKDLFVKFEDGSTHDGWGPYVTDVGLEVNGDMAINFQANARGDELKYLDDVALPGGVDAHRRFADGTGYFTYKLPVEGANQAKLHVTVGNNYVIRVRSTTAEEEAGEHFVSHGDVPAHLTQSLATMVGAHHISPVSYAFEGMPASAYKADVGDGAFVYVGLASSVFARSVEGAQFVRDITRYGLGLRGIPYEERDALVVKRGSYAIAHALRGERKIDGRWVDLLDPTLPVVDNPVVALGESALYYDVAPFYEEAHPRVMYASRELLVENTDGDHTYLVSAGPWQSQGVVRLYSGHFVPAEIKVNALKGLGRRLEAEEVEDLSPWLDRMAAGDMQPVGVDWDWDESTQTVRITFDQWHSGVLIDVRWE